MAERTGIEWTESTWNPVTGCSKVSQGCRHCYAERDWRRLQHLPSYAGRAFTNVATHGERLEQPLRWRRPRRIFVNSMSDLFHADVPDEFIDKVFAVMALAKQHTFQILTKRPDRMRAYLSHGAREELVGIEAEALSGLDRHTASMSQRWPFPLPNVWLGVSVEDQATADERIPTLLQTPAAVRWISAEPLLGPVDLTEIKVPSEHDKLNHSGFYPSRFNAMTTEYDDKHYHQPAAAIDWVVVGGESGPKARPMHPEWARSLRDQCAAAGVPFLFKQWGEYAPMYWTPCGVHSIDCQPSPPIEVAAGRWIGPCEERMFRVGKKAAGRLLDGALHDAFPDTSTPSQGEALPD